MALRTKSLLSFRGLIDSDVVNDPDFTANTAVPAEFAGSLAGERFIGHLGRNQEMVFFSQGLIPLAIDRRSFGIPRRST
jgi:hypothetical protein